MSILDRILRRKDISSFEKPSYKPLTSDELGLPEMDTHSAGSPEMEDDFSASMSPMRSFQQPNSRPTYPGMQRDIRESSREPPRDPRENRDAELILSKLDTIISLIKNLDFRVSRLEKVAGVEEKHEKYRW